MNVFINRQLIYNYPEQLFADRGVMAIEHADFDGIERLALVTGGEIVSTFGHPDKVKIGKCDLIEQVSIGDETLLKFSGGRRDDPPGGRHPEGGPQAEEGGPRPLLNLSQITRCINITTTPVSEQTN